MTLIFRTFVVLFCLLDLSCAGGVSTDLCLCCLSGQKKLSRPGHLVLLDGGRETLVDLDEEHFLGQALVSGSPLSVRYGGYLPS